MNQRRKKTIAPIVVTILFSLYYIGIIGLILWCRPPFIVAAVGVLISLCLTGVLVAMFVERMREIRSGEEDDLSKY